HVPLTYEGIDATYHLVDEAFLSKLRPECILMNTSRGPVVDNLALATALGSGKIGGAVLDVWENEPGIDIGLLDRVNLGTSHIAGYSLDGKANATAIMYRAACRFLGAEAKWELASVLPKPYCEQIEVVRRYKQRDTNRATFFAIAAESDEDVIADTVQRVYDIERDDAALRELHRVDPDERGHFFDDLRKNYPVRREFHNTGVVLPDSARRLAESLSGLGFHVR
ncbi:DUF3410 domain-containing protein, partial [bacterium]|nr:DUF3410 domain-containing protein [bacterium]